MLLFDVSCDSTGDLRKEYREERNIWFAPLTFSMEKDGQIEEGLDNFTTEEEYVAFYEKVSAGYFPRTAKLNYEGHLEFFTKMAAAGVKDVLHFTISSGLANTVALATQAAAEVKAQYPQFTVYVVDPLTATVGQGLLAGIAADCRDEGMTAKDAYEYIMGLRQYVQHCIIPNDLLYLKKGGRLSSASAMVGAVLSIKPMLTFDTEGKLKVVEKCKGMKKAFSKVVDCMSIAPVSPLNKVVVVHTNNYEGAKELATLIETKVGVKPSVAIMGPVIGSHVGPGSVSCCWISDRKRETLF